jgi:spermidine synthase
VLELGVGAWAVAFPWLLKGSTPIYRAITSLPAAEVLHALLAAVLLLPPTIAMGATLPLLSRLVADRRGTVGDQVGGLYAANTFGAVAGTVLAGLVTLPLLGQLATTWLAAAGNTALGLAAVALDPRIRPPPVADDLEGSEPAVRSADPVAVAVAGLAGMAALSCEVTWARLTGLILGGTTYAFTAMLLAVLLGVALGGRIGGPLADDALRWRGTAAVLRSLGGVQCALALVGCGMLFVWPQLPYVFVAIFDAADGKHHPSAVFVASLACAVVGMLPPAVLMGAAFPLAVRAAVGTDTEVSGPVGRVYATNTLGGVLGAVATGFWAVPALGLQGSVALAAAVNALAGALALGRARSPLVLVAIGLVGLGWVRAPWDPLWMSGGMYQYVSMFEHHDREALVRWATGNQELLFHDEGRSTVVIVARNVDSGNLYLANNGKVDASTSGDLPTQVLVALAGAQYVEKPDRVLVIGLASGITAGAVTVVPDLGTVEVAELEPAVVKAAALFSEHNHDVLNDPRVQVVVNDGRNHVLRADPGTYDLIVNEPSNPYLSGVANLFTDEFWRLGKTRLKPGGVWTQWIQLYGMGPDELRGLLRTFAGVYPHVALYVAIEGADIVVVGSDRPLDPDPALVERLLAHPPARDELASVGIRFPLDLVALHAMDRAQVLAFAGDAPLVTDDNLRVEYAAPLWLHTDVSLRNWDDLLAAAQIPWAAVPADPLDLLDLAAAYRRMQDEARARVVDERILEAVPSDDPLAVEIRAQRAAADAGD